MKYHIAPLPNGCEPHTSGLSEFQHIVELPPADIVAFFRTNIEAAKLALGQSEDKRCSPSTFIAEDEGSFFKESDGSYTVGWFGGSEQHIQRFTDFSEAVADYLLFSFGKGRLKLEVIDSA